MKIFGHKDNCKRRVPDRLASQANVDALARAEARCSAGGARASVPEALNSLLGPHRVELPGVARVPFPSVHLQQNRIKIVLSFHSIDLFGYYVREVTPGRPDPEYT